MIEYFIWFVDTYIWEKVFKNGLSKFCERHPLKNLLSPLLKTLSRISTVEDYSKPCQIFTIEPFANIVNGF